MNFVQGTYNQGGSGVLNFCVKRFNIGRKAKDINNINQHETDLMVSHSYKKDECCRKWYRESYFTYLAPFDKNKDHTNGKLGVLSFKAEKLKIWSEVLISIKKIMNTEFAKLIGYEFKSKSTIVVDFMYHTEIMMPDAVMPCRLHDCRDFYKRNRGKADYRDQVTTLQDPL